MNLLAIDTSNQVMTVTACQDEKALGQIQLNFSKNHSTTLMPAISSLMETIHLKPHDLTRIVVAKGPGSYTGLRIGVTTAKTLAWTLKSELVGVSSLAVVAAQCKFFDGLIIPIFDARRKNVYSGAYKWKKGRFLQVIKDQHIAIKQWLTLLQQMAEPVLFVGEDASLFLEEITEFFSEAAVCKERTINIPNGLSLAQLGMEQQPVEDIHGFLPAYLKLVEAEEKWLETHNDEGKNYVERI